jgi:sugar O-acyltransferase (sialic acid O-acetyltransferase NeuD family)
MSEGAWPRLGGVKPLVLFGIGDFGRVALAHITYDSPYAVAAFTVHERFIEREVIEGTPVVPFERLESSYSPIEYSMFVAIGYSRTNRARAGIYHECKQRGYELISYVSSNAHVAPDVSIGDNCFVLDGTVVQPYTRVGSDVILWSGSHVGHDSAIEDHVFVAPRAAIAGNCRIGELTFVGVNATLRDGITIAPESIIGAGAVVMRDTTRGEVLRAEPTEALPKKSWELTF